MGHKIKYGAKFFLKIIFFPYLPTHFWGVMLPETNIIYFGLMQLFVGFVMQSQFHLKTYLKMNILALNLNILVKYA